MTRILTVNTGSSSVRLAAFEHAAGRMTRVAGQHLDGADEPAATLRGFVQKHDIARPDVIAHRVVHGGARFTATCRIDAEVESEIERLAPYAPLHNPRALAWIRACRETFGPGTPQAAVFDTMFYAALPPVARDYAIDAQLAGRHGLRRYGFHGLAHQAMWRRWRELAPRAGGRVISLQLGAGCSATAVMNGAPQDTSMGFSPLEGLVMATRCGDLDPGLVTYLQRAEGLDPQATEDLLNRQCGLLGVSGSSDMRALLDSTEPRARLAVNLYCYRIRKYIGAYVAVLGGVDAILFGGGVGEHAARVRAQVLEGMDWAGIRLDPQANDAAAGTENCISRSDSRVAVWVLPVDEAGVLAREAVAVMAGTGSGLTKGGGAR
jgi:acetate kinase